MKIINAETGQEREVRKVYLCDRKRPCRLSTSCGVLCHMTTDPRHAVETPPLKKPKRGK